MRKLMAMVLVLGFCAMSCAQYEREAEERPLGYTVNVDEVGEVTYVFLHSVPVPWSRIEGIKNPIFDITVNRVTYGRSLLVTAAAKEDPSARLLVTTNSKSNESQQQLRERLSREIKGEYGDEGHVYAGDELEKLDLASAHYESDRAMTLTLLLERFPGYDDELKYDDDGYLVGMYQELQDIQIVIPDHLYRLKWFSPITDDWGYSEWVDNPWKLDEVRPLLEMQFDLMVEVKERKAPSKVAIFTAGHLIWQGKWPASITSSAVRQYKGDGFTETTGPETGL